MNRSLLTRIATGTLGLALIALAATGAVRTAHADDPIVITPTTPTTVGPAPAGGIGIGGEVRRPDLVVRFEFATCGWKLGDTSPRYELKLTVINTTFNPTTPAVFDFLTDVKVDGVLAPGMPLTTEAPFWSTDVFHVKGSATPGMHTAYALTDSTDVIDEVYEGNNAAKTRFSCPLSAS